MRECSAFELEDLHNDRNLYPRATLDCDRNVVFDISATKELLNQYVEDGKHNTMTPKELHQSCEEYIAYPL
eukprot:15139891-Ditylum_brightwellii.AAC.1